MLLIPYLQTSQRCCQSWCVASVKVGDVVDAITACELLTGCLFTDEWMVCGEYKIDIAVKAELDARS